MIVVTAASQNHYYSLLQFIDSLFMHSTPEEISLLVVYNLGISKECWEKLNDITNKITSTPILLQIFDFSKYPEYMNIQRNAGEYAWKPIIIRETSLMYRNIDAFICWMDAGNIILHNGFGELIDYLKTSGVYSMYSFGDIRTVTHPSTLSYMKCPPVLYKKSNRNGACYAFNADIPWVAEFLDIFAELALTKKCIAPVGSSRANHRQDQSVFTVLYYMYQMKHGFNDDGIENNVFYSIHNDIG